MAIGTDKAEPVAVFLSDPARAALETLPQDARQETVEWLTRHLASDAANDPPIDLPGVDKRVRMAISPEGPAAFYRKLDETEAERVKAAHGYLVAELFTDFLSTLLAAPTVPGAIAGNAIAETIARALAHRLRSTAASEASDKLDHGDLAS